ncbi:MAG: hypothetical protein NWE95_13330 [Candidatus Bathyarchaeota archaeon]|nr:hypothetical protein [Candidatus Bathyarchaeota archaeon]
MTVTSSAKVILKKTFSLTLIFNALITLGCVAGILLGFYRSMPNWKPFAPYLIDGNLFWLVIVAALINIFPSASIGRVLHTGRFLFHHYVYGAFLLVGSSLLIVAFASVPLHNIFFVDDSSIEINAGRVFILAGLTLFIDDLPDVSKRIEAGLNWFKSKAYKVRRAIHALQLLTGVVTFYCGISALLCTLQYGGRVVPNSILIVSLFITSFTSFALVKRKAWLKITPSPTREPVNAVLL